MLCWGVLHVHAGVISTHHPKDGSCRLTRPTLPPVRLHGGQAKVADLDYPLVKEYVARLEVTVEDVLGVQVAIRGARIITLKHQHCVIWGFLTFLFYVITSQIILFKMFNQCILRLHQSAN